MKLPIPVSFHSARKILNDQTPKLRIDYQILSFLEPLHKEKNNRRIISKLLLHVITTGITSLHASLSLPGAHHP